MLAALMFGVNDIQVKNVDVPAINDNELLVKVNCAGICGSDLKAIKTGLPGIGADSPRILGHELSGTIEEVGKNVKGFAPHMRITVAPNVGCGNCSICLKGDYHLCSHYKAIGFQSDGGFAEYVRIPEDAVRLGNVMQLPENVSFEEAAIVEPLSCVYNGLVKCPINPGDDVLILGAGPIGMMHALFAKLAGASRVMITNRSAARLEICKTIDESFIPIDYLSLKEDVLKLTGGKGVDVCIVANSSPEALNVALDLAAMNGRVNFFASLPKEMQPVTIDSNQIYFKQLLIAGATKSNNHHIAQTLKFISTGLLKVKPLVSARFGLADFNEAVQFSMGSRGLKTVIVVD